MKYLSVILLVVLSLGCESISSNQQFKTFVSGNISFAVDQERYALGDTVVANLQNNSSTFIMIGNPFSVEKKQGDQWTRVGPSSVFTLEGIKLEADSLRAYRFTLSTDSSWHFPNYSFSAGKYRVKTLVRKDGDRHTVRTSPFTISAAN